MKVSQIFIIAILILASALITQSLMGKFSETKKQPISSPERTLKPKEEKELPPKPKEMAKKKVSFLSPLDRLEERVTLKAFGDFITRETSPVQPERFAGFHTGIDLEVFPAEIEQDVFVKTVCEGKLLTKRLASGYGGVVVQSCILESSPVTVVYGHMDISSVTQQQGAILEKGIVFGKLGENKSSQTDGERKHLHLGFHKGGSVNLLGYVSSKKELEGWIDPLQILRP